jgi:Nucleotide modification associated domain 3
MNVILLRVGIDSGCGGIQGPLFADGGFELLPIPDDRRLDARTYGNTVGRRGRPLVEYFPERLRDRMTGQPMHVDPEFETFTYGDPTRPKHGLARLQPGDLLVFYAGLRGFDHDSSPALYLIGFFDVAKAVLARNHSYRELCAQFGENFHVRHRALFSVQKETLVLVKGTHRSLMFKKAHPLSITVRDRAGQPLKVISPAMRRVFGDLNDKPAIQRSAPRRVDEAHVRRAVEYTLSLS